MIRVKLKLFSYLKQYNSELNNLEGLVIDIKGPDTNIFDLIKMINIPQNEWINLNIIVNNQKVDFNNILEDGDSIYILPLICGG